jgi:hypothetical protein
MVHGSEQYSYCLVVPESEWGRIDAGKVVTHIKSRTDRQQPMGSSDLAAEISSMKAHLSAFLDVFTCYGWRSLLKKEGKIRSSSVLLRKLRLDTETRFYIHIIFVIQ